MTAQMAIGVVLTVEVFDHVRGQCKRILYVPRAADVGPEVLLEEMWCYGVLLALRSPRTPFPVLPATRELSRSGLGGHRSNSSLDYLAPEEIARSRAGMRVWNMKMFRASKRTGRGQEDSAPPSPVLKSRTHGNRHTGWSQNRGTSDWHSTPGHTADWQPRGNETNGLPLPFRFLLLRHYQDFVCCPRQPPI